MIDVRTAVDAAVIIYCPFKCNGAFADLHGDLGG